MATSKRDVLDNIEEEWRALSDLLATVPLDALDGPRAVGEWSLKDLVGHITSWEEVTLDAIDIVRRGGNAPMYDEIDEFNAKVAVQKRDVPLQMILVQLGGTHERLVARVGALPERLLRNAALSHRIRVDTWEHYREHRRDIERWLSNRTG